MSSRAHLIAFTLAVVAATPAAASTLCQLPDCTADPPTHNCAGGTVDAPLTHGDVNLTCGPGGGSFNLTGTIYEHACSNGLGAATCSGALEGYVPWLRFWEYDNFAGPPGANSGCEPLNAQGAQSWLLNAGLDIDPPVAPPGHWSLWQASFEGAAIDGDNGVLVRAVAEISFIDLATDMTKAHSAWYAIASVPWDGARYPFETVTGAVAGNPLACNDADILIEPVPTLSIQGRSGASCINNPIPLTGVANPNWSEFYDVDVDLDQPAPKHYSEAGLNGAPDLIAGYQVLYWTGATEPLTSQYVDGSSGWSPVHDPSDPGQRRLGVVPVATSQVKVSVPNGRTWLALRIVYQDATVNPLDSFEPSVSSGPVLASPVGQHCGPIEGGQRLRWCDGRFEAAITGELEICAGDSTTLRYDAVVSPDTCCATRVPPYPLIAEWSIEPGTPHALDPVHDAIIVRPIEDSWVNLYFWCGTDFLPGCCCIVDQTVTVHVQACVGSGLYATASGSDVVLTWATAPGADSYNLRVSDGLRFDRASSVVMANVADTTYTVVGASAGRSYQVFAVVDGVEED